MILALAITAGCIAAMLLIGLYALTAAVRFAEASEDAGDNRTNGDGASTVLIDALHERDIAR